MARAVESFLGEAKILSAREQLKGLANDEPEAAMKTKSTGRKRSARKGVLPIGLIATGIAAAATLVMTNPRAISNISAALQALRASNPVPPPREIVIAKQGEELGGPMIGAIEQPAAVAPAAPDTAASPNEVKSDTGVVLENSSQHLELLNAETMRRAEIEKAKLVQEPVLPIVKEVEPPPPEPQKETAKPAAEPLRKEEPATGFIDIAVEPSAEISIDGRRVLFGDHLSMLELPAGMHEIVCRSDGYHDYVEAMRIQRGELSRRRISLERLSGAILFITTPGSQIYIDGTFKGTVPLDAPLIVPAGTHRVELKKAGFRTWSSAVLVPQDETVRLNISLVPASAAE
jgi:hypothetical protein